MTLVTALALGTAGMAAALSVEDLAQARGGGADAGQDVNADLDDTTLAIALGKGEGDAAPMEDEDLAATAVAGTPEELRGWEARVNAMPEDQIAAQAFGSVPPLYDTDRLFDRDVTSALFLGMQPLSGEAALSGGSTLFGPR